MITLMITANPVVSRPPRIEVTVSGTLGSRKVGRAPPLLACKIQICGILRIDRIEEKSSGYSFITTAHEDMPYPMGTFIVWVGFSISEQFSYRQNVSMGAFYSTHAYTSEGAEYPSISSRGSGYWFKNSGDMVQFLRSRIHIRK